MNRDLCTKYNHRNGGRLSQETISLLHVQHIQGKRRMGECGRGEKGEREEGGGREMGKVDICILFEYF